MVIFMIWIIIVTFTSAPSSVDLVLVQQFEHLPEYARRYITVKAARRFTAGRIGDSNYTINSSR